MNGQSKPVVGAPMPTISVPQLGGGTMTIGGATKDWTLFVVYRGRHCGRCKNYLNTLEAMNADWEKAGFTIKIVSADTKERASLDIAEYKWSVDVGYGLSVAQMATLGLYVTEPTNNGDAIARFAEPGIFCIDPDGNIVVAAISNAPSARPDLAQLLDGMQFTISNNLPFRGTVTA
ncbi:redoxin domain-containing protein [Falsihalocynthiibacter arcticus]|uniref:Thioredoxin peroxidase n=1 Tax=Falsihalocynthiibacter arcticus TaxID=1579316 RepID=A0A126V0G2_9RHOB|nr:redoxin domain-containing protein [Falsihalocynthiibacter arcticus]AML51780.1 thioredoxin peroxidase [Falsihalocynthiibacter arcticus]